MRQSVNKSVLLLCISILLTGCLNKEEQAVKDMVWDSIVNQEFSNYDVFAGSGLYFYEEESLKYCTYKIYGSGVPVAFEHTSRVLIKQNGTIQISLPKRIESSVFDEQGERDEAVYFEITYDNGDIKFGDMNYAVQVKSTTSSLSQYEIKHVHNMIKKRRQGS